MVYKYEYARPALTVDCVVFAPRASDGPDALEVLLIQRAADPFQDSWALPGGFVDEQEPLDVAASRELLEETGLSDVPLEQFHTFGDPYRDPRGWTVAVGFVARLQGVKPTALAASDAAAVEWFPVNALPPLAFDHDKVIRHALAHVTLQSKTK